MSDTSTAVAVAPSIDMERPGAWRRLLALAAAPFIAFWRSWSEPDTTLAWRQLSERELIDIGASPEQIAEAQALREFELNRAHALSIYYW